MSLNIELFKKVRDKIATTPEAYEQGTFGRRSKVAPCGTEACIAGWACLLSGAVDAQALHRMNSREPMEVQEMAAKVLGLTEAEAEILFTGEPEGENFDADEPWNEDYADGGWPAPYGRDWYEARRRDRLGRRAHRIAIQYLDHIIKTGKVLD